MYAYSCIHLSKCTFIIYPEINQITIISAILVPVADSGLLSRLEASYMFTGMMVYRQSPNDPTFQLPSDNLEHGP